MPAGFLLAGGASSRMGRDKALLPVEGIPLLLHLAKILSPRCSTLSVLAPAGRYESLGLPVLADIHPGCGPLSGVETALHHSTDWALIVACDLAQLTGAWLDTLLAAPRDGWDCIASGTSTNEPNPLCALWHHNALAEVESALQTGNFRARSVLSRVRTQILIPPDPGILANWNRPEDLPLPLDEGKANRGG